MTTTEAALMRREKIVQMTLGGKSAQEISEILGITKRNVTRHRSLAGISAQYVNTPISEVEREAMRVMIEDGVSFKEIARTTGRSQTTVMKYFPGQGWTKSEAGSLGKLISSLDKSVRL